MPRQLLTLIVLASMPFGCRVLGGDEEADSVLFLTQSAPQVDAMDALYQGKVIRDGDCIRLADEPDAHTVVWPYGFRLSGQDDAFVLDSQGHVVGRIGGRFRLGGGEVATLLEHGPVAESQRQEALATCPGRFWIVGSIE